MPARLIRINRMAKEVRFSCQKTHPWVRACNVRIKRNRPTVSWVVVTAQKQPEIRSLWIVAIVDSIQINSIKRIRRSDIEINGDRCDAFYHEIVGIGVPGVITSA